MAKRVYVGIGDKARKVKKMYVGVGDKARAVKKAYIGIGGVARPFWPSLDGVEYYGLITPLSVARYHFRAKTTPDGEHVLFGGGFDGSAACSTVDAYDKNLTRTLPTPLSQARCCLSVATAGNRVVFVGGSNRVTDGTSYNTIDAYDTSLTRTTGGDSETLRHDHSGVSLGDFAVFAGGRKTSKSSETYPQTVIKVDSSLTVQTCNELHKLNKGVTNPGACYISGYALFAGGQTSSQRVNIVSAYNTSLTRTALDNLSSSRSNVMGASVGEHALFAGGVCSGDLWSGGATTQDTVDVYDASLTKTVATPLSAARYNGTPISSSGFAIFCGGAESVTGGDTEMFGSVDAYDASLTRTTPQNLTVPRYNMAGDAINGYALFGGGTSVNVTSGTQGVAFDEVEAYQFPT